MSIKVGDRVRVLHTVYPEDIPVGAVLPVTQVLAHGVSLLSGTRSGSLFFFFQEVEKVADDSVYGGPIPEPDLVDHPPHYTTGGIECFDAMAAMLSREEMIGYLRGNSFKYRWRFRHKGGAEDLRKAAWYEARLLALVGPAQNAT